MTYASEVLADTPAGYWKLNEASGSLADSSGSGLTLTLGGGSPVYGVAGPVTGDNAVNFNTTAWFTRANVGAAVGQLAVEFWIKPTVAPSAYGVPCYNGNGIGNGWMFVYASAPPALGLGIYPQGSGSTLVLPALTVNVWTHVVVSRDADGQQRGYYNGAAVAGPSAWSNYTAPTNFFRLGDSAGQQKFQLAHVAYYAHPLSAARAAAHYGAAAPPATPVDPPGISIAFTDNWDVANPTWTRIDNVPGRRVRGYTIDRGRPNEFEKTGTGTATIRLADTIGTFDPTDPVAATTVAPGKQANISLWNPVNSTWHTIFRGYVESWRYVLDQTRQYTEVELTLTDGFAILSRYELVPLVDGALPPYTGTPDKVKLADFAKGNVLYGETVGTVGDRILAILGDAGWPAALATNWIGFPVGTIPDIFSGNVRLGPKAYAPGTSALDALFDAADGEFPGVANLYMSANGHVRFRGRQARFRPAVAQYGITPWLVGDPSAWSDANAVPLAELEWSHGEDNLYNSCTATPQGVGTGTAWRQYNPDPPDNDDPALQTATAPASIATHGLRGLTFDNLQTLEGKATGNSSKVETALFAAYYGGPPGTGNYSVPTPRISRAVFKTRRPANTHAGKLWEFLCNVEISDLLTVKTDHPGAGGFNADFYVEGIHYTVRPGPPEHAIVELSLDVSPRAHWTTNPFDTDPDPA